jgi:acetylornithine deacetylase/succinyl-diaminopimelate desuccinylase-like protein
LKYRAAIASIVLVSGALSLPAASSPPAGDPATRQLAHDIFKQLVEINTTDSVGNVTTAAQAMAQRLLGAGFSAADISVLGPNERKRNMVARYRGDPLSRLKPILIFGHLDVVEARREDWTTDPFEFVEKDGYYYGRGTQDMKVSDAIAVTDFIRMKREEFVPSRDIILALTADEEGGQSNGVDWLLKNHRELIDAEYALNPDSGGVVTDHGKPLSMEFEATEKLYADFQVVATNPGGHSSLPKPDNAIYHVADALAKLEKYAFSRRTERSDQGVLQGDGGHPDGSERRRHARNSFGSARSAGYRTAVTGRALQLPPCAPPASPTMMKAGHAPNALPQRAEANVNCRIFPGHSQEEIRLELVRLFDDPRLAVRYMSDTGEVSEHGSDREAMVPPPVNAELMGALRIVTHKFWPGLPVFPEMETGASDSNLHDGGRHSELRHLRGRTRSRRRSRARPRRARAGRVLLHGRRVLLRVPEEADDRGANELVPTARTPIRADGESPGRALRLAK